MATLTNNSGGPRTLNTEDGPVVLENGESRDDIKMSSAEAAAMKKHGLLDAPEQPGGRSIADVQREIASLGNVGGAVIPGQETDDVDDAEVKAFKDSTNAEGLRQIAEDEGVELEGDDNKADMARKIIAARASGEVQ